MKFRPLTWRNTHPYVLSDRVEDITEPRLLQGLTSAERLNVDRRVVMYGYVRGTNVKSGTQVHIPGAGDFMVGEVKPIDDPCPLPGIAHAEAKRKEEQKKREADAAATAAATGENGTEESSASAGPRISEADMGKKSALVKKPTRRSLNEKETLLYAPMSDIGNVSFGVCCDQLSDLKTCSSYFYSLFLSPL